MCGIKTRKAKSEKMFIASGFSMAAMAAPSKTAQLVTESLSFTIVVQA